ncbi:hypothetical protein [Streptomyces silvensis]|nr:hypothetical protein [Streptomyces silvensis]
MSPSQPRSGFSQYIADVVTNLFRLLGPDPAAAVTRPAAPARRKG